MRADYHLHGQCDESKPHCQCCKTYGVLCNYDANVPELQLLAEAQPQNLLVNGDSTTRRASRVQCLKPRVSILNIGATRGFTVSFALNSKQTRLLYHFQASMAHWRGAQDGCLQLAHEVGSIYPVIDSHYHTFLVPIILHLPPQICDHCIRAFPTTDNRTSTNNTIQVPLSHARHISGCKCL